jgi:hypothetical protein
MDSLSSLPPSNAPTAPNRIIKSMVKELGLFRQGKNTFAPQFLLARLNCELRRLGKPHDAEQLLSITVSVLDLFVPESDSPQAILIKAPASFIGNVVALLSLIQQPSDLILWRETLNPSQRNTSENDCGAHSFLQPALLHLIESRAHALSMPDSETLPPLPQRFLATAKSIASWLARLGPRKTTMILSDKGDQLDFYCIEQAYQIGEQAISRSSVNPHAAEVARDLLPLIWRLPDQTSVFNTLCYFFRHLNAHAARFTPEVVESWKATFLRYGPKQYRNRYAALDLDHTRSWSHSWRASATSIGPWHLEAIVLNVTPPHVATLMLTGRACSTLVFTNFIQSIEDAQTIARLAPKIREAVHRQHPKAFELIATYLDWHAGLMNDQQCRERAIAIDPHFGISLPERSDFNQQCGKEEKTFLDLLHRLTKNLSAAICRPCEPLGIVEIDTLFKDLSIRSSEAKLTGALLEFSSLLIRRQNSYTMSPELGIALIQLSGFATHLLYTLSFEQLLALPRSEFGQALIQFQELTCSATSYNHKQTVALQRQIQCASAEEGFRVLARRSITRTVGLEQYLRRQNDQKLAATLLTATIDGAIIGGLSRAVPESIQGARAQREIVLPDWSRIWGD